MGIIQQLKDEGVLVLEHHYRRNALDQSGNSNHGVHTATKFTNQGLQFPTQTSVLTVADASNIQLAAGAIVLYGEFIRQDTTVFVDKQDAGGVNYRLASSATQMLFTGSGGTVSLTTDVEGARGLGINFTSGQTPEGFTDGASAGSYSGAATVTVDDAPLKIGNAYSSGSPSLEPINDVLIFSRELTTQEHADVYAELSAIQWRFDPRPAIVSDNEWRTGTSIFETVDNVTSGLLSNSGFYISTGSWKVPYETVDGSIVPVFQCTTSAGIISLLTDKLRQTNAQAAYGEWRIWLNKFNQGQFEVQFVGDIRAGKTDLAQNGYTIQINTTERVKIYRVDNGVSTQRMTTSISSWPINEWVELKITRASNGSIAVYGNDVLLPVESGSNPVIDTTYTESNYMVINSQSFANNKIGPIVKTI